MIINSNQDFKKFDIIYLYTNIKIIDYFYLECLKTKISFALVINKEGT
jgi:hypothetical protein